MFSVGRVRTDVQQQFVQHIQVFNWHLVRACVTKKTKDRKKGVAGGGRGLRKIRRLSMGSVGRGAGDSFMLPRGEDDLRQVLGVRVGVGVVVVVGGAAVLVLYAPS